MTNYDLSKPYIRYCEDVVTNKIVSSEAIYLACKRFKDWFDRDDIYFDYVTVDKYINFVGKMKHFKGEHAGKPFILLDWQKWVVAGIFGWKWCIDDTRVTQNVLLFISRKNGKTALAAALALICATIDGEQGAEIDFVANSGAQARIGFEFCHKFAGSLDPNGILYKRYRDTVRIPHTSSVVQVLSSDSMGLDGYNASCFIIDEFHAQRDWSLYDVLKSSQGARKQPLGIVITTAGFRLKGYPLYEMRLTNMDILRGVKKDDSVFSAIYELDDGDDFKDETIWTKCCPSLGQTVYKKYLQGEVTAAVNQSAKLPGVLTKNFNKFVASMNVWIPDSTLKKYMQHIDTKLLIDENSYGGIDLAAVSDLTSFSILFPPNPDRKYLPDKFIFKSYIYLPEEAIDNSINTELYKQFRRNKDIIQTPGNVTDYDVVLEDVKDVYNSTSLQDMGYDNWNATQFAINAESEGIPLSPYSQTLGNFNRPTKEFERLLKQGKIIIDDNECVRWCFSNVELKYDFNENCKPIKAGMDQSKKIDPVISMLEALGTYLLSPEADLTIS